MKKRSTKKRATLDFAERYFWYLFGGIWLFVGLLFAAIGAGSGYHEVQMRAAMEAPVPSAEGTVLVKTFDQSPPTFHVDYRFFRPDGRKYYGSAKVPPANWDKLQELQPVQVFYFAADPDVNWIEGAERSLLLTYIFSGLGSLLTLVGGTIVWKAWRRAAR